MCLQTNVSSITIEIIIQKFIYYIVEKVINFNVIKVCKLFMVKFAVIWHFSFIGGWIIRVVSFCSHFVNQKTFLLFQLKTGAFLFKIYGMGMLWSLSHRVFRKNGNRKYYLCVGLLSLHVRVKSKHEPQPQEIL